MAEHFMFLKAVTLSSVYDDLSKRRSVSSNGVADASIQPGRWRRIPGDVFLLSQPVCSERSRSCPTKLGGRQYFTSLPIIETLRRRGSPRTSRTNVISNHRRSNLRGSRFVLLRYSPGHEPRDSACSRVRGCLSQRRRLKKVSGWFAFATRRVPCFWKRLAQLGTDLDPCHSEGTRTAAYRMRSSAETASVSAVVGCGAGGQHLRGHERFAR